MKPERPMAAMAETHVLETRLSPRPVPPPIHGNQGAGDVTREVRTQELDDIGAVLGRAVSPQGDLLDKPVVASFHQFEDTCCSDHPGGYAIHVHAKAAEFLCQISGVMGNGSLVRAVMRVTPTEYRDLARMGRHGDDLASLLLFHDGGNRTAAIDCPEEIDLRHEFEQLRRHEACLGLR